MGKDGADIPLKSLPILFNFQGVRAGKRKQQMSHPDNPFKSS